MARVSVATQVFDGTEGHSDSGPAELNPSNWTQMNSGSARVRRQNTDNVFMSSHGNEAVACWSGAGSFTTEQYSEIVIAEASQFSGDRVGCIINANGTDGSGRQYYTMYYDPGTTDLFFRLYNSGYSDLATAVAATVVDTDIIRIENHGGGVLKGWHNTSEIFSITGETTLSNGTPGVLTNVQYTVPGLQGDNWEGGNITADGGGGGVPSALMMMKMGA